MEPFIADFLLDKKVPKIIRYAVLAAIDGFVIYICINVGLFSEYLIGNIIGFAVAAFMIALFVLGAAKIHRN